MIEHNTNEFYADPEGKLPIELRKRLDRDKEAYYTGRLHCNISMDLTAGQSFMVFVSEDGFEEIQVGPLDPRRKKFAKEPLRYGVDNISISLNKHVDKAGETYYVGELFVPKADTSPGLPVPEPVKIDASKGLFFSVYVSREGCEKLQITPLKVRRRRLSDQ